MLATTFEDYLALAQAHGLELDSRIQRRQVEGVWGMYAVEAIPKDTIIASLPRSELIPKPEGVEYPVEIADKLQPVHSAARQLAAGSSASHYSHVVMFETLDEYRTHSAYFFNQEELDLIARLNPLLHRTTMQFRGLIQQVCADVKKLDPELDDAHILRAALNWQNRCWDKYGFLPVLDLFNHSDTKGSEMAEFPELDRVGHRTIVEYQAGDQVYISYAPKDMYRHALCYNYFDSNGVHYIDYALRVVRTIADPFTQALAQKISQLYPLAAFKASGKTQYQIREPRLFYLDEQPSEKLLKFFEATSFGSPIELQMGKCTKDSVRATMKATLEALLGANKVEQFSLDQIPVKLQRFYFMLKKEREMLQANLRWLERY